MVGEIVYIKCINDTQTYKDELTADKIYKAEISTVPNNYFMMNNNGNLRHYHNSRFIKINILKLKMRYILKTI